MPRKPVTGIEKASQNQGGGAIATVYDMLASRKHEISSVLPEGFDARRLMRIALNDMSRNRMLMNCSPETLVNSVVKSAQLGLEPDGILGQAYIVPYGNRAELVVGWRGMIELARRSGQVKSIVARCVHAKDHFDFAFGLEERLEHKPAHGERGPMIYVYAIAHLKDGGHQFEVLTMDDVAKARASSASANSKSSPWQTHPEAMAKKTAIRQLFKYLPISITRQVAAYDEAIEQGRAVTTSAAVSIDTDDDDSFMAKLTAQADEAPDHDPDTGEVAVKPLTKETMTEEEREREAMKNQ